MIGSFDCMVQCRRCCCGRCNRMLIDWSRGASSVAIQMGLQSWSSGSGYWQNHVCILGWYILQNRGIRRRLHDAIGVMIGRRWVGDGGG